MAGVKDKVVTVESLSVLHEHNKTKYMTKESPNGSGSFSINRKAGTSIGERSVAIGYNVEASGSFSFAEGTNTVSRGLRSHSEGCYTIASGDDQHVQGKRNIEDTANKYAHIVGNGTSDTKRSNAHTVDWDGNAWYQGDVYVGGTSQDDATKLVKSTNVVSIEYGDTLPSAGTKGRIFFKRVTE